MKIAVIILGILGALSCGALGSKWISDYRDNQATIAQLSALTHRLGSAGDGAEAQLQKLEHLRIAAWIMLVGALASLAAAIAVGRLGRLSAPVLLGSAIVPALLAPQSLLAGFLLLIAGALALFVRPQPATRSAATRLAA